MPPLCLHGGDDLLGERALVERARAAVGDRLQRRREIGLHQRVAARQRRAVAFEKNLRRRRPAREPRLRARQRIGEIVLDREALARQRDRGRDQLRERELARAVLLMRERQPRDRAGHADAERRIARLLRIGFALLVEEHVARHRGGRGLAIVDRDRLVARGEMHQHEAAAADIAGLRMRHGEREADRDRGIDRVAALPSGSPRRRGSRASPASPPCRCAPRPEGSAPHW